jgi:hypothetical protein
MCYAVLTVLEGRILCRTGDLSSEATVTKMCVPAFMGYVFSMASLSRSPQPETHNSTRHITPTQHGESRAKTPGNEARDFQFCCLQNAFLTLYSVRCSLWIS